MQFPCSWGACDKAFNETHELHSHLIQHLMSQLHGEEKETKSCDFIICGVCRTDLTSVTLDTAERHVHFHAWLSSLRAIGLARQRANQWPRCQLPASEPTIPLFPTPFECGWTSCDFSTNNVADLYAHVSTHPQFYNENRRYPSSFMRCNWDNCSFTCSRRMNLVYHLRTHTQEKVIACPDCGILLMSANYLRNHLQRQQILHDLENSPNEMTRCEAMQYKCPRCFKIYANKGLLQIHVAGHVNRRHCPHCYMTLRDNNALRRHILFRHTTAKKVPCPFCPKHFKESSVLLSHVSWCHKDKLISSDDVSMSGEGKQPSHLSQKSTEGNPSTLSFLRPIVPSQYSSGSSPGGFNVLGPLAAAGATNISSLGLTFSRGSSKTVLSEITKEQIYPCPNPPCCFKTKSKQGLGVHLKRIHPTVLATDIYSCHLCDLRTNRGFELTRHLIRVHKFQRPADVSRFTYAPGDDGFLRLQMTRLDSIEVAKALLGPQAVDELVEQAGCSMVGK